MGQPSDQASGNIAATAQTTAMSSAMIDLSMSHEQTEATKGQMPLHRYDRSTLKNLRCHGATVWRYEEAFEDFMSLFFIKFGTLGLVKASAYLEHEISTFVFTVSLHGSGGLFLVLDRLLAAQARDVLTTTPTARQTFYDILMTLYTAEMGRLVTMQGFIDKGEQVQAVLEGIKLQQTFSRKLQDLSTSAPEALRLYATQLIADHATRPIYAPNDNARLAVGSSGSEDALAPQPTIGISVPVINAPYGTSAQGLSIGDLTAKLAEMNATLLGHKSALEEYDTKQTHIAATVRSASHATTELSARLAKVEQSLTSMPYQQYARFPHPQLGQSSMVFKPQNNNNIKGQADFVDFENESQGFQYELQGLKEDIEQATEAVGREKANELQYLKNMTARLDKLVMRFTEYKKKHAGGEELPKASTQVAKAKPPGAAMQHLLNRKSTPVAEKPAETEAESEAKSNMSKNRKIEKDL